MHIYGRENLHTQSLEKHYLKRSTSDEQIALIIKRFHRAKFLEVSSEVIKL